MCSSFSSLLKFTSLSLQTQLNDPIIIDVARRMVILIAIENFNYNFMPINLLLFDLT